LAASALNTTQRKALLDRAYAALGRGEIRYAGPAAERLVQQFPDYAPGWGVFSEVRPLAPSMRRKPPADWHPIRQPCRLSMPSVS